MGWINVHWGVSQVPNASTSLPHKVVLALAKVVEQKHVSLFPAQLVIECVPTMSCLETLSDFMAIGWGIHVRERNELESLDKEQVKNQEAHITETFKIKHRPKDVNANVDMVDADTSKQVSPTNPHVSKVARQFLGSQTMF
jgi:hypothetical protein